MNAVEIDTIKALRGETTTVRVLDLTVRSTFPSIDRSDERAIERWNHAVNEEMADGIVWLPPFVSDFWSGRRKKPKPSKCTCEHCGNKHALKVR